MGISCKRRSRALLRRHALTGSSAIKHSVSTLAAVFVVGAALFLLWAIADLLLLMFAGLLLAVSLNGAAMALARGSGIRQGLALSVVLFGVLGGLVLLVRFLGAELAVQFDELVPRLDKAWHEMLAALRRYEIGRVLVANNGLWVLSEQKFDWLGQIGGVFSGAIEVMVSVLIVCFIGLYGAITPRRYRNGVLRLVPPKRRPKAQRLFDTLAGTLRWWMLGTLVKMAAVGIATTLGLLALGMPLALALGLIAFLCDFVPYLGPILAAIPALLVGLAVSPTHAAYVGMLYLAVQAAENYILSPLIDMRSVSLPPVVAIGAQLLLGGLFGTLGVLFATPLAAGALVTLEILYLNERERRG